MLTPVTKYQAKIYQTWLRCNPDAKLTAKSLPI